MLPIVNGKFFIFSLIKIYFLIKYCECYNYNSNINNNNKILHNDDQVEIFDHRLNIEQNNNNNNRHGDDTMDGGFLPSPQSLNQMVCTFDREGTRTCNCGYSDEELLLPKFSGNVYQIILLNCKIARIQANLFSDLPHISWVRFHNIEQLILEEKSLQFAMRDTRNRIQLEFINVVIEDLSSYAISGNVEQIRFENTRIGAVHPFAVTGIRNKMLRFSMVDTTINYIEPQSFKKFTVEEMELLNSTFGSDVPSRSFYDIDVTQNLRIRNCTFMKIHSAAFVFQEVSTFTMTDNRIEQLNGEAIHMQVRDTIMIRNNTFESMNRGAFRKIVLDNNYFSRNSEPMPFNFITNHLAMIGGPQTIEFNGRFNLRLSQVNFMTPTTCDRLESMRDDQFLMTHSDTLYFRMENGGAAADLTTGANDGDYQTLGYILNNRCIEESYLIYIIIGVAILVIVLLVMIVIIVCVCVRRRRARKLNIIMPEGKTYRETQIVMQIENHGLLKTDL